MPTTLSWNEVRDRAIKFSRDWAGATREDAEAKSFWDAFFDVFGKSRRTVASWNAASHSCSVSALLARRAIWNLFDGRHFLEFPLSGW